MRFSLPPETAAATVRRGRTLGIAAGALGLLAQLPWPVLRLAPWLWSSALGLGAVALSWWLLRQARRRSSQPPAFDVTLHDTHIETAWAGEAPVRLSYSRITKLGPRRGWFVLEGPPGTTPVIIPRGLPELPQLRRALREKRSGGPASLTASTDKEARHAQAKQPTASPQQALLQEYNEPPWLSRISDLGLFGGMLALLGCVIGGVTWGPDVAIPMLGLLLSLSSLWVGTDRGWSVIQSGRITQSSPYSAPHLTTGRRAKLIGWLNLAGAALLFVLGVLVLSMGLQGP